VALGVFFIIVLLFRKDVRPDYGSGIQSSHVGKVWTYECSTASLCSMYVTAFDSMTSYFVFQAHMSTAEQPVFITSLYGNAPFEYDYRNP